MSNISFYVPGQPLGPYSTLLIERDRIQAEQPNNPDALQRISQQLEEAKNQILQRDLQHPPLYRVSLQGRVVGHLIGTKHLCNEQVANNRLLHNTIAKSSGLFVEMIMPEAIHNALAQTAPLHQKFFLDYCLHQTAKANNVPVTALETYEEVTSVGNPANQVRRRTFSQEFLAWDNQRSKEEQELEQLAWYQDGNVQQQYRYLGLLRSEERLEIINYARNRKWAERIIQTLYQLSQEKRPICIAIGLGHLLGTPQEDSLNTLLRRKGFEVTRITKEEYDRYMNPPFLWAKPPSSDGHYTAVLIDPGPLEGRAWLSFK